MRTLLFHRFIFTIAVKHTFSFSSLLVFFLYTAVMRVVE